MFYERMHRWSAISRGEIAASSLAAPSLLHSEIMEKRCAASLALMSILTCSASCSHAYEQRQERFRERSQAGCNVLYDPPVQPSADPVRLDTATKSKISHVIEDSQSELVRCYLESLAVWPQLEGSVVINFTVRPDGTVGDSAVAMHHSTVFDASIGCCIARVAPTWTFPAPPDSKPFAVEYPFELLKDPLKIRLIGATPSKFPFTPQFAPTVILAPSQSSSGTELNRVW